MYYDSDIKYFWLLVCGQKESIFCRLIIMMVIGRKIVLLDYPVSYDCVLKQFKGFAMDAKVTGSPRDYGLHSFRRGGVTTAVNNGCDEHTVQKQMRVASTKTVSRYATLSRRRLKRANFALFK